MTVCHTCNISAIYFIERKKKGKNHLLDRSTFCCLILVEESQFYVLFIKCVRILYVVYSTTNFEGWNFYEFVHTNCLELKVFPVYC